MRSSNTKTVAAKCSCPKVIDTIGETTATKFGDKIVMSNRYVLRDPLPPLDPSDQ